MAQVMTTKEIAKYLKLHEITICKLAAEGNVPAIRIGRVWRFDKEAIDEWIAQGQKKPRTKQSKAKVSPKAGKKQLPKKKKGSRK